MINFFQRYCYLKKELKNFFWQLCEKKNVNKKKSFIQEIIKIKENYDCNLENFGREIN